MQHMQQGRLFYVIGPSGAGKDSLMRYARQQQAANTKIVFAHRYITRPPELAGENHIYLEPEEFDFKAKHGFFALQWNSHGLRYGIGLEINLWLARGFNVVVNGSREYLFEALEHYPDMQAILIRTSPDILRQRLINRQRESLAEIELRLERAKLFNRLLHPNLVMLDNDAALSDSGAALVTLLSGKLKTEYE